MNFIFFSLPQNIIYSILGVIGFAFLAFITSRYKPQNKAVLTLLFLLMAGCVAVVAYFAVYKYLI